MMLDTYDGMVTSVTAVPSKAVSPIDFTPLRKTVITHTANTKQCDTYDSRGDYERDQVRAS